jgi:hypothetical protein
MGARDLLPFKVRYWAKRSKARLSRLRLQLTRIRHRSEVDNAYHCCVHKTGSQWIRAIFQDRRVYTYSGLRPFNYQTQRFGGIDERRITERSLTEPFPLRTVVTPIYIDYSNYAGIPKPENHRAFFVMRDPRDVLVSWYFSSRYSHGLMGVVGDVRKMLSDIPKSEGLCYSINHLGEFGLFEALSSWVDAAREDKNVMLVRFEDITGDDAAIHFGRLFEHLDIAVPDPILRELLDEYSFERLSRRKKGDEDKKAHYRKGVAGDWMNHFDDAVSTAFNDLTGDLIAKLGYE